VLAIVAGQSWLDRYTTTAWKTPLWVGIFPANGDGSDAAARYVAELDPAAFDSIATFFEREGARYGLELEHPIRIVTYPVVIEPPPAPPPGAGLVGTAWWSLKLRWYARRHAQAVSGPAPQIRIFVLFNDPVRNVRVPHSLGLQKGLVGVVYAFASRREQRRNAIVIAHELLHTVGATDKYDPETDLPRYPDGYGDPNRRPRYPQPSTEIMAGRRALSPTTAEMPESLAEVVVGSLTAREIRWVR
jgi:hypothetical protein